MSTIRVPPNVVRRTTMPSGSAAISPITAAACPPGLARSGRDGKIGLVGCDDGDELAFVGDVEGIDAEEVAGADDG